MLAITGSMGFIGKSICPYLPFPQKRLIFQKTPDEPSSPSCFYLVGDLTNHLHVDQLIEGTHTLIHLACKSNPRNSNHRIQEDINQELLSTIHLFETFAKKNPKGHIVFASTGGNMYHSKAPFILQTEKDVPKPSSSYSIQKLTIENYLRLFCHLYGIKATVLRISNPYGTLLPASRAHGLIGIAFNKILANEVLSIIDSPESVRDYLHLNDLAKAFRLVVDHPPGEENFRLFNVSSGIGNSLKQVLHSIEKATGRSIKCEYLPSSHMGPPSGCILSYQHIYESLGWFPQINLDEGLKKMWESIK